MKKEKIAIISNHSTSYWTSISKIEENLFKAVKQIIIDEKSFMLKKLLRKIKIVSL